MSRDLLESPLPALPGLYALQGPSEAAPRLLRGLAQGLAAGLSLFWIDAGNAFDAYGLGSACRAGGLDPRQALSRVRLSRPFNMFQLETVVCQKLPLSWRGEPVVLSDPLALLHDPDAPAGKAARVWERVLAGMRALPAVWLVLAVRRKPPPGCADLCLELQRTANAYMYLGEGKDNGDGEKRALGKSASFRG
ncbi:MAG: hypothetical protein HY924_02710 [Elusimicrobia bacterium]|nr:hypothetical protein [Elusimicrobiota bacterium]